MTTYRVAKRQRFTVIDRRTINDDRLSFRALGILSWLLDKPDDWQANADQIAGTHKEGRDAVRAALSELERSGYLIRRRWRDPETKRWACEHTVHETPQTGQSRVGIPAAASQRRKPGGGKSGDNQKTVNEETTISADSVEPTPNTPTFIAEARARLHGGWVDVDVKEAL